MATAVAATLIGASAGAQQVANIGFKSVGRGAPLKADLREYELVGAAIPVTFGPNGATRDDKAFIGSARNGEAPKGVKPLAIDLFTSKDFYKDKALWTDPRYFRCNSSVAIEEQWGANGARLIGEAGASTAAWGRCDRDYPREAIVSPYPFKTAQEHYQALLAETKKRGGPTEQTYATLPNEWNGRYMHPGNTPGQAYWYRMRHNQVPTILSLLTPEYQQRMVQQAYHEGVTDRAQWPSQYCWPEGFMRRWHEFATWEWDIMVTPQAVQILTGVARNFITNIHVGREFKMDGNVPRLGADVPRWYGETIGFWDKDTLITWTSNIQGWMVHGAFEYSNKMQTIEIYTPNRDAERQIPGLQPRGDLLRPRGARGARAHHPQLRQAQRLRGRRPVRLHRLRADDLPDRTARPRPSRPEPRSSTACPTSTAARGRRSGSSTSSRAWRSRNLKTSLPSNKVRSGCR